MSFINNNWWLVPLIITIFSGILCPAMGTVLITHKRLLQVNLISHCVLPGLALALAIGVHPSIGGVISGLLGSVIAESLTNKKSEKLDLTSILKDLSARGCLNVLMEGGGKLLGSLIDLNLVNKVRLFISPMLIGGESSTDSIGGEGIEFISQSKKLTDVEVKIVESDIMVTGKLKDHV